VTNWCDDEMDRELPGDELVPDPSSETTRAVTVEAPSDEVWPWIVQLGQGRGGFYSYSWLENLFGADIHNVDRIVPELQRLAERDSIRMVKEDYWLRSPMTSMTVEKVDPGRTLVLRGHDGGTWTFHLEPIDDEMDRELPGDELVPDPSSETTGATAVASRSYRSISGLRTPPLRDGTGNDAGHQDACRTDSTNWRRLVVSVVPSRAACGLFDGHDNFVPPHERRRPRVVVLEQCPLTASLDTSFVEGGEESLAFPFDAVGRRVPREPPHCDRPRRFDDESNVRIGGDGGRLGRVLRWEVKRHGDRLRSPIRAHGSRHGDGRTFTTKCPDGRSHRYRLASGGDGCRHRDRFAHFVRSRNVPEKSPEGSSRIGRCRLDEHRPWVSAKFDAVELFEGFVRDTFGRPTNVHPPPNPQREQSAENPEDGFR